MQIVLEALYFNNVLFLQQAQQVDTATKPSDELISNLTPYFLEAGIDPDVAKGQWTTAVESLLTFNIVDKRRIEMNDIAQGSNFLHCILLVIGASLK